MLVTKTLLRGWWQELAPGPAVVVWWWGGTHAHTQLRRLLRGRASASHCFCQLTSSGEHAELSDSPSVLGVALTMLRLNYCFNSMVMNTHISLCK